MGRPEKPVDQTVPELARLATFLREERARVKKSYAVLATCCTEVSEATLKRAAAGTVLPGWHTVDQYLRACHVQGSQPVYVRRNGEAFFTDRYSADFRETLSRARSLWEEAKSAVVSGVKPRPRPLPTCRFVYDEADLSARLRELHEWAWSPSAHVMEARGGDYGALPHSTAHRIIKGQTIPGHLRQMEGFLRACGLPESRWKSWIAAWGSTKNKRLLDTFMKKLDYIVEHKSELAA
ncbi:hypothetical protein [Streptomyces sp. NPDC004050]